MALSKSWTLKNISCKVISLWAFKLMKKWMSKRKTTCFRCNNNLSSSWRQFLPELLSRALYVLSQLRKRTDRNSQKISRYLDLASKSESMKLKLWRWTRLEKIGQRTDAFVCPKIFGSTSSTKLWSRASMFPVSRRTASKARFRPEVPDSDFISGTSDFRQPARWLANNWEYSAAKLWSLLKA